MIDLARGLSPAALEAIAGLEHAVVAADGGRLKLEWGALRARPGDRVDDLLWWDGRMLTGFLGLYDHGWPAAELAGMVHPQARRRGIATSLLDAAMPLCRDRGLSHALLITPRRSPAGRALALARGGTLDHSEYALYLPGAPAEGPSDPRTTVRPMTGADGDAVRDLTKGAFGFDGSRPDDDTASRDEDSTLVAEHDGQVVGSLRLIQDGDAAGVYGFAVSPEYQGRGIGRDMLRRVCRQAIADGADGVRLEVAVGNDRALGLYTSLGFTQVTTEDYYRLPAGP